MRGAILVEYEPVAIGDLTYICPIKGMALSKMPAFQAQTRSAIAKVSLLCAELSDVAFTHCHLFHTQMRIIIDK
jgi:hypothetical protein